MHSIIHKETASASCHLALPCKNGEWHLPSTITRNHFINKSLSSFAYNVAIGCEHGCRFCYVPDASTNKLAPHLEKFGITDPDAEWGDYVFVRQWSEIHSYLHYGTQKQLLLIN